MTGVQYKIWHEDSSLSLSLAYDVLYLSPSFLPPSHFVFHSLKFDISACVLVDFYSSYFVSTFSILLKFIAGFHFETL